MSKQTTLFIFIDFQSEQVQFEHIGNLKSALKAAWDEAFSRKKTPADIRISLNKPRINHTPDDGWQTVSPIERV
tara:strand:- start:1190 stop:1411 length:222 start_codon:yes stop_codon:yes gene_type:complete